MASKLQPTYEDILRGTNSANATFDLDLIIHGLDNRVDVKEYLDANEHEKAVMSQLYNVYLYKPYQFWDVYEGCWIDEEDFAITLADDIVPSRDVAFFPKTYNPIADYFDYDAWTVDLFNTDYMSLDCKYCERKIIARYD